MTLDSQEVIQRVNSHLAAHPNATLQVVAEKLGITGQSIEQILRKVEGATFEEFRENKRLDQALRLLEASASDGSQWPHQGDPARLFRCPTLAELKAGGPNPSQPICHSVINKDHNYKTGFFQSFVEQFRFNANGGAVWMTELEHNACRFR